MPPKRSQKRKANGAHANADGSQDAEPLSLPDRGTWPGWVEMESEPAFFNVMLKEMGVQGVKIQEVYGLDDDMLAILPQPVHALIFLFRYHTTDQTEGDSQADHSHIWFANQLPEFACATVALLNIVNNIPGIETGPELRHFKNFTDSMDPVLRGDAIDSFDFVRRIHNSFARENDLLTADMHMKGRIDRAKKQAAAAKGWATREAKKNLQTPEKDVSSQPSTLSVRSSTRQKKPAGSAALEVPSASGAPEHSAASAASSASLSDDGDFKTSRRPETNNDKAPVRRSARTPKPRQDPAAIKAAEQASDEEDGFHFIAYMPIDGHVWKLDGLDSTPQHLGSFQSGSEGDDDSIASEWIRLAQPAIAGRMAQFEGADIQFNLMAVVRDPAVRDMKELVANVKALQTVNAKLDGLAEDWSEIEGAEMRKDVLKSAAPELGVTQLSIDSTDLPHPLKSELAQEDDLLGLIALRKRIISQQGSLRGGVRDALAGSNDDDEKARHRRHDYRSFVRAWLGALAEDEVLGNLVEGQ